MRIIAGKWKGRPLASFKASHIRPTTDRVKEVLFNMIQFEIDGATVIDLFAGTGSLSFESLSRGAEQVLAVESNRKSLAIVEKNRSLLEVGDELQVRSMDVLKFIANHSTPADIVLIDPPFTKKMADEVMEALAPSKLYHQDTVIFIESSKQEKLGEVYGPLQLKTQKNFGDKLLSQFVVNGELASS